ncbi:MAG: DUF302 domain-containing protein [Bacteroidota bacterium]
MKPEELFFESESPFDFETSVEKLTETINEAGWKTPAIHDLQQTMRNFGKDVMAVKVFEICHPKHSSRILELNDERVVSALMPCRISVYEKTNGITYFSRINSALIAGSIGGIIAEVMNDATHDVEIIIQKTISK